MKFGKSLCNQIDETLPEWRDKFLSYKDLKKKLKLIAAGGDRPAKRAKTSVGGYEMTREEEFLGSLEDELEKEEKYVIRQKELQDLVVMAMVRESKEELMKAWYMEENEEDKRLPHHKNPKEFVSLNKLAEIGILYWHLNPKNYENDEELNKIRETRGYNYMDLLDLCPEKIENYEEKLRNFYTEHIHADEEIRYCLEGSGYFDVRDKDDRWIRIWIKGGDMIILPAGIYHRFTLDTSNYVKALRLFVGEPVWTPYNRPHDHLPARKEYIDAFVKKEEAGNPAITAH
ncbi:uncharacterized protein A4U43_C03F29170 [Asparagus officinalis]|uniref:Acireductone dioxygenase n=1 Tax=Asparagus officinalis TaxID=4686 RepID=A0A5P1FGJ7_ASPOF|nr:uncharacterized protein A4U43_C03F29170 [Asparagus officinalis]